MTQSEVFNLLVDGGASFNHVTEQWTLSLAQAEALLETLEARVRERCARIAESGMEDSAEARLIAAAIREECT